MNENIFATHPHLAHEWHYEKNSHLVPEDFTAESPMFVWWMCNSGHVYQEQIKNRAHGVGCPYDMGKRLWVQSIASAHPHIASQWDYEKNDRRFPGLSPDYVAANSQLCCWWICNKGHSFEARVSSRIKGYGCLICHKDTNKRNIGRKKQ